MRIMTGGGAETDRPRWHRHGGPPAFLGGRSDPLSGTTLRCPGCLPGAAQLLGGRVAAEEGSVQREHQTSGASTDAAILRTRSGSAMASISTILPPETTKPITTKGRPRTVTTTPADPFTSAGCRRAVGRAAPRSAWP